MKYKLKDKLLLVIIAIVSTGLIILFIAFARKRLSEEWTKFVYACMSYLVVLIAIGLTFEPIKQLSKIKLLFFQIIFYILTVSVAFIVFSYGLLPLPKGSLIYVLPMTALSVVSLIVLDYLRRKSKILKK